MSSKKKYKTIVSNTVIVPVSGSIKNDERCPVRFKFELDCKRMTAEELKEALEGGTTVKDVIRTVTTGWRDQRLVLEEGEDGKEVPADFCADSFDELLSIAGLALLCFNAYVKENGATEKN